MLRISNQLFHSVQESQGLSRHLSQAIAKFWRFSQFYGDYQSLSPSKRRQFVIDQQKRRSGNID